MTDVRNRDPKEEVPFEKLVFVTCRVDQAGPIENGETIILLSAVDGRFAELWVTAKAEITEQALDTALAAIIHQLPVGAALTGTSGDVDLYRIHLMAAPAKPEKPWNPEKP